MLGSNKARHAALGGESFMNTLGQDSTKIKYSMQVHRFTQLLLRYGTYILFLLLCAVISILSPHFFTLSNLTNVLTQTVAVGIIAVGMTFVIIVRGIDVSVGATVALASAFGVGAMMLSGQPWYVGVIIMLVVGIVVGFINGFSSSTLGMPAFLVTLATQAIARGFVTVASGGRIWNGLPAFFNVLGTGRIGPIPNPVVIMFVVFILGHLLLSKTAFGRKVYSVGSNPKTARVSGINVNRIILLSFVLCGFLSGLSSLVLTARMDAFTPSVGIGYEFSAIAACVIGGASLFGGEGNLWGTLVGVLIMGVINNALNLLGVSAFYQDVIRGSVIFLAVLLDSTRKRYTQIGE